VDSTPPADTTEIQQLLARQQELFVHAVSDGRRIPPERLLPALDGRDWPAARLARLGVIDSVGWREDALAELGRLTGLGRSPRTVDLRRAPAARRAWALPRRVAVVYAGGDIEVGESGSSLLDGPYMGSDTVIRQLEQAFHARGVRAVVLRVDSPGGSVLASRLIDHAIERLERETGRPLVVSMASVAASGGYMIACHADCIYADRFTHTGSIGVLFLKPSLQGLYAKLHVREDDFERGDYMGGLSYARDWRPQDQASADSVIRRLYHTFVNQVADGRRLQGFEVDAAAQGRVWLGEDALDRHLVDGLGGLDAAIEEARRRGGVPAGEPIGLLEFHHPAPPLLQRLLGRAVREEWEQTVRAAGVSGVRAEEDDAARSLAR
jgi:protease-4